MISKNIDLNIIECVGPEILTFREILEKLLNSMNKKRILIPFPLGFANFIAKIFELMPNPLLTQDQLRLLKYDNISSGQYKTNFDIGVPSKSFFIRKSKIFLYVERRRSILYSKSIINKNIFIIMQIVFSF